MIDYDDADDADDFTPCCPKVTCQFRPFPNLRSVVCSFMPLGLFVCLFPLIESFVVLRTNATMAQQTEGQKQNDTTLNNQAIIITVVNP